MNKIVFSGHQPNILPYLGVFYKAFKSDFFVLDDDVQYSTDGMHNSNYIKNVDAASKFTIPVRHSFGDCINEVKIDYHGGWDRKFLKSLQYSYKKAAHFDEAYELVKEAVEEKHELLAELNIKLFEEVCSKLGIKAKILVASKDLSTNLRKNDRNVWQCKEIGANVYYSGVGGKAYNDEEAYRQNGIEVVYSDYTPVRYRQIGRSFVENLSVVDYLMNEGFVVPESWRTNCSE